MKKIIFGYWFYALGGPICMGFGICGILMMICFPSVPNQETIYLVLLVILSLIILFFFIVTCHFLFQFTILSDKGVRARTIWRTIRYIKWEDIKEVRYERFYVSVQGGFTSGWYVFDDGVERKQPNGLNRKNTHITVPASKGNRKIIEMFWHEPIIEKEIKN